MLYLNVIGFNINPIMVYTIQSKIHNGRGKINCVMIYELNTHTVGTKH